MCLTRRHIVLNVSIHALLEGDGRSQVALECPWRFNPRPYKRDDERLHATGKRITRFNPRPLHKGRQVIPLLRAAHCAAVFQSALPSRGVTCRGKCIADVPHVSIHAPTRGATSPTSTPLNCPTSFQSTPLHEGRRDGAIYNYHKCLFQSTPLHVGRRLMHLTSIG